MSLKVLFPTRITAEIGFAILLTGILMGIWFIIQPVTVYTIMVFGNASDSMGISTTSSDNIMTLLRLGVNVAIPIMVLGIWIWAIVSSARTWYRGEEQYYA